MTTTQSLFYTEGLDERSLEILLGTIEKNNLPGFDYFEFKRSVVTLAQMQIEESTAYKSAFATAATVGLTKEKLLETAAYYRNLLEKEKEHFGSALDHQKATKVLNKQEEVKRLKDQIDRHKAEITRLQDEITAYQTQIEQSEASTALESEKIEKSSKGFERTHAAVLIQIDRDIENIHKHLA